MATHQSAVQIDHDGASVLTVLAGRPCPDCEGGQLERGTYKGNRAVLCDSCETPRAQTWDS
ncbi:hypothetical protein OB905_05335 [Halobacteria archaeon AArc-dxtr1]|nr:hypothetical protein [Halobacteria archaeon AArc-dxtr1]